MIRPWYLSRLFWFGLFAFFFLIWAWNDSATRTTWITRSGIGLDLRGHSVGVGVRYGKRGEKLRWVQLQRSERPAAVMLRNDEDGCFLRLPFPFVMVSYLILWAGLMFWWQRRKTRLLKLQAEPLR